MSIDADGLLHVSNHSLTAVATCDTKAILQGLRYTSLEESAAAFAGVAAHKALARWARGADVDKAMRAFKKHYKAWSEEHVEPTIVKRDREYRNRLTYENLSEILRHWMEAHPLVDMPFKVLPDMVEQSAETPLTKDGNILFKFIMDAVVERDDGLYVLDHKAQPLSAHVLTPTGFQHMGDIWVGDMVIGANGQPTEVVGVFPQGIKPVYKVRFRDGGETRCTLDHLWQVCERTGQPKSGVLSLQDILSAPEYQTYGVPMMQCADLDTRSVSLPISPYLLGALLGDGYLGGTTLQYSTSEVEQEQNVKAELPPEFVMTKNKGKNYTWIIKQRKRSKHGLFRALTALGLRGKLSGHKFVPGIYKTAPISARMALLQGLLDTDGNVYEGHISFTSVSRQLAEDVVFLVRSLGGMARWRLAQSTKQQAHKVSIRFPASVVPFRLQRKIDALRTEDSCRKWVRYIESVTRDGEEYCQCIRVAAEDGLYVTDDFIVTHNTSWSVSDWLFLRQFRMGSQMTGYIWGAQSLVTETVIGAIINAIEFSNLPEPGRKCGTHKVDYAECQPLHVKADLIITQRTPEQLAAWKKDAIKLANHYGDLLEEHPTVRRIHKARMQGVYNGGCARCPYEDFCKSGRPAGRIDQMLAKSEEQSRMEEKAA